MVSLLKGKTAISLTRQAWSNHTTFPVSVSVVGWGRSRSPPFVCMTLARKVKLPVAAVALARCGEQVLGSKG
jgi:hypothetical protein